MNERFVNIKVDREERPDLDAVYMDAVVALSGHGGWPMTVFLTPEGEPFFGGTYYPPEPRHGLPSFRQLLVARRRRVPRAARRRDAPGAGARRGRARAERAAAVARAADRARSSTRPCAGSARSSTRGGAASARAEVPARLGARVPPAPRRARAGARRRSTGWRAGGMYDLVGGGFHRYSVDERWLVPHFEKMLYDNALLVPAYLHGWARHRRRALPQRRRADASTTCCASSGSREGGSRPSQDADTDGVERHDVHVGAEDEGAPRRAARAVRARAIDHPRRARRGDAPAAARDPRAAAAAGARRQGDHVVERPGLAALAEAGRMLERPDVLETAARWPSS